LITPLDAVQDAAPDSNPGLTNFCPEQLPPPVGLIVQENWALPVALVESVAVAVTV